ncbi:hypothetical protein J5N97_022915 [Dioscorea zingiberensis]|uniref:Uncharacterized protein n=1 Tax=Dioscorea zingiberensis TaxID=325984 RepID=A0A9D5HBF9_9LILI|nr:hypothetical protein J5N97_022915 [Dioscorea zingiberensis]
MGVSLVVHELDEDPCRKEMENALARLLGGGPAVLVVFISGKLISVHPRHTMWLRRRLTGDEGLVEKNLGRREGIDDGGEGGVEGEEDREEDVEGEGETSPQLAIAKIGVVTAYSLLVTEMREDKTVLPSALPEEASITVIKISLSPSELAHVARDYHLRFPRFTYRFLKANERANNPPDGSGLDPGELVGSPIPVARVSSIPSGGGKKLKLAGLLLAPKDNAAGSSLEEESPPLLKRHRVIAFSHRTPRYGFCHDNFRRGPLDDLSSLVFKLAHSLFILPNVFIVRRRRRKPPRALLTSEIVDLKKSAGGLEEALAHAEKDRDYWRETCEALRRQCVELKIRAEQDAVIRDLMVTKKSLEDVEKSRIDEETGREALIDIGIDDYKGSYSWFEDLQEAIETHLESPVFRAYLNDERQKAAKEVRVRFKTGSEFNGSPKERQGWFLRDSKR